MGSDDRAVRNPFVDAMATELIDLPEYGELFSPEILIGETLSLFEPKNVVLTGALSSGKTMLLNLIRYVVMNNWLKKHGSPPGALANVAPFVGISINLVRAGFHTFGRRTGSARSGTQAEVGAACAADFLTHHLLIEYLRALQLIFQDGEGEFRDWLGIDQAGRGPGDVACDIAGWACWYGYYDGSDSLGDLLGRARSRLATWESFLNMNMESVPDDIWASKTLPDKPLHRMGNLLSELSSATRSVPLFVCIDQYEELQALGGSQGATLQRVVNTLIKGRDPVAFYKLGVRTHDWGRELRVWGSEATVEAQRDYVRIDLSRILMRRESQREWVFPKFAADVAKKRIEAFCGRGLETKELKAMYGGWTAESEAEKYSLGPERVCQQLWGDMEPALREALGRLVSIGEDPLDALLATVWVRQRLARKQDVDEILRLSAGRPWMRRWWHKERVQAALFRLASLANDTKKYYGWNTIVYLSGGNIYAFLLICSRIWDVATKQGIEPLGSEALPVQVQTYGIYDASVEWQERNLREHGGGPRREDFAYRFAAAVKEAVVKSSTMSNPGHSGFSLEELELHSAAAGRKVSDFLEEGVGWGYFEERRHTPKVKGKPQRRKFYLHPLLSPVTGIPYSRVKEPYYAKVEEVWQWIFEDREIALARRGLRQGTDRAEHLQEQQMSLGDLE